MTVDADDEDLPIWSFRPNWREEVQETLEWKTAVHGSNLGAEQRYAQRLSPRRSLEYGMVLTDEERTFLDVMIQSLGHYEFLCPLWHDIGRLTAPAAPGDNSLSLDTTYREFLDDGWLFLQGPDAFTFERLKIDTVASDTITLVDEVAGAWPAGTKVYPLRRMELDAPPDRDRLTSTVETVPVRLRCTRENDWPGTAALETYRDYPVLSEAPDAGQALNFSSDRNEEIFDPGTGLRYRRDLAGRGFATQQWRTMSYGRAQHAAHRDLLYTLKGRLTGLWVPTFNRDFVLAESASMTDTTIEVNATGLVYAGGPTAGRQDLCIELRNGSVFYCRIASAAPAGPGREVLYLDDGLPWDVTPQSVKRICFMDLMRLNQDRVEITHKTDTDGTSTLSLMYRAFDGARDGDPENFIAIAEAEMGLAGCGEPPACRTILAAETPWGSFWHPLGVTRSGEFTAFTHERGSSNGGIITARITTGEVVDTINFETDPAFNSSCNAIFGISDTWSFRSALMIPSTDYVMAMGWTLFGGSVYHAFLLYEIQDDGTFELVGHQGFYGGGVVPSSFMGIGFADGFTEGSRLVTWCSPATTAHGIYFYGLRSIAEMKGFPAGSSDAANRITRAGSQYTHFPFHHDGSSSPNFDTMGFCVPGPAGKPRIYFYVSRAKINSSNANPSLSVPVIEDLKATYPNGCMLYIEPTLIPGTPTWSSSILDGSEMSLIANDDFNVNGPPFDDEFENIDGSPATDIGLAGFGGFPVGYQERFLPVPQSGNRWLIPFHKELSGELNTAPCGTAAKMRLFSYDAGTGLFTSLGQHQSPTTGTVESFDIDEGSRYLVPKGGTMFAYSPAKRVFYETYFADLFVGYPDRFVAVRFMSYSAGALSL